MNKGGPGQTVYPLQIRKKVRNRREKTENRRKDASKRRKKTIDELHVSCSLHQNRNRATRFLLFAPNQKPAYTLQKAKRVSRLASNHLLSNSADGSTPFSDHAVAWGEEDADQKNDSGCKGHGA
ncbi:hypothetical protein SAMN05421736_101540 [Evansella caseinilytica]|uniref:Uncharacterized protein n=1 Tax=Evansella caseinilytica TaxID=1503961 RepID=A0A1H3HLP9_9BACI|nr:hypothetical protein SAMN05421736_101540 [Evansella caseinilytica]